MQYYILVFLLNYLLYKWQDGISYNTETTNSYYRVLSIVLRSILWSRYTKPKIWKLETKPRWKRDIELIYICRSISVFQQFSLFWHFTQKVCWFELKYYWLTDVTIYHIRCLWWKSYHSLLKFPLSIHKYRLTGVWLTEFTLLYHIKSHCTRVPPS